jgi:hypothetical protein
MSASGFTPISLYYSTTASAVPTAANLVPGELAINTNDGKLYYEDSSGVVQVLATKSTGSIGGSNTQVQFNNSGSLGGSSSFTWDGTTVTATKFAGALNGTVGATTASTGAFTTLSTSSTTTLSGLTASTALALDASKNVVSVTNTGTGNNVLSASPTLTGTIAGASLSLSSLTSGRVPYATTAGLLTDSANLLYSGTDLTVYGLTVGRGAGAISTNTAVGASALAANTTGTVNVAVGRLALQANTTGGYNTATGNGALYSNISGANNSAFGEESLFSNTTASHNTAVGFAALSSVATNPYNTAVGSRSLEAATGSYNTALGYLAGSTVTTATGSNTSIGAQAGAAVTASTGSGNVAVGAYALTANTTGGFNVAIGGGVINATSGPLMANTTGGANVAVGSQALQANTTASNNTAVGYQAGYSNTTGDQVTYIGQQSGYGRTGYGNTAIGYQSLYAGGTGYTNTAIGRQSLSLLTSGFNNTAIGNGSGSVMTTGSNNTILGNFSGNQGGLDIRTASDYIVLSDGSGNPRGIFDGSGNFLVGTVTSPSGSGNLALGSNVLRPNTGYLLIEPKYPSATGGYYFYDTTSGFFSLPDNTNPLGNPSYRWTTVYATTALINTSDAITKQQIRSLNDAEKAVAQSIKGLIRAYKFNDSVAEKGDGARIHVGVIAQDVQSAFTAEGLDSSKYAMFCSDTWYEVDGQARNEKDGFYTKDTPNAVEVTRLGIRYDELLAFVISTL